MNKEPCSIALDIGGTRIKMAMVQGGKVLRRKVIPAHSEGLLQDRLPAIEAALLELVGDDWPHCCGIGIAMPCLVDASRQQATEIYGKFIDAPQLDLRKWAEEKFHLPIVMEQDSKAALVGEVKYGAARGYQDVLLLIMGTGVGTAVMLNGKLLDSRHHFAGALGSHIQVELHGRQCTCGNRGCLEAYTGGWALPGLIREHAGYAHSLLADAEMLDFSALAQAVRQGDALANDVLQTVVQAMRAGMISLIHAYDPAAVILSGGPLNMGEMFTQPLLDHIQEQLWGNGEAVRFMTAEQPDESVVLGLHDLMIHSEQALIRRGEDLHAL